MKIIMKIILIIFTLLVSAGCENTVPEFSGKNAFQYLEKQCSFGPRNPGSIGYKECLTFLLQELVATADTVWTQPFTYDDLHRGGSYDLQNIIARFNPNAEKQILLGAHWDTRPWSDKESDIENQNIPLWEPMMAQVEWLFY
jgi:hypothetical protein